jgi:hypothetical protein
MLLLTLLALASCSIQNEVVSAKKIDRIPSPLEGTWETACKNGEVATESYKLVFLFNSVEESIFYENFYSGINCIEGNEEERWISYFQYKDKKESVEFTRTKVEMYVLNTEYRDTRNTDLWCGYNNWAIGIKKDVTDIVCDGFGTSTSETGIEPTYTINDNTLEFFGYDHFIDLSFNKN